jgi:hypothetical protein
LAPKGVWYSVWASCRKDRKNDCVAMKSTVKKSEWGSVLGNRTLKLWESFTENLSDISRKRQFQKTKTCSLFWWFRVNMHTHTHTNYTISISTKVLKWWLPHHVGTKLTRLLSLWLALAQ